MRLQSRIPADQIEHGIGAGLGGHLHLRGDLGFGDVVVLEDQPVALAVVFDEIEERLDGGAQTLPVVGRRTQRLAHPGDQVVDVALQDRQVQLELRREVLIENRFTHTGTVGDLVHACGVVAAVDEDLARGDQQLTPPLIAGQTVTASVTTCRPLFASPLGGVGEIAHQVLNLYCSGALGACSPSGSSGRHYYR